MSRYVVWFFGVLLLLQLGGCGGGTVTIQPDIDPGEWIPGEYTGPIPCETPEDCPDDSDGCVDGFCGFCKWGSHCKDDRACVQGGCQPCEHDWECDGLLCNEDGACVPCTPGEDDPCNEEYESKDGVLYQCVDMDGVGMCMPHSCPPVENCQTIHMVCDGDAQACKPCVHDNDCIKDGGYPAGTECVEGMCWSPLASVCGDHDDCPEDAPICGSYHVCRTCQDNVECEEALKLLLEPEEFIDGICLHGGKCVNGECGGIESKHCEDGLLCHDDSHMCGNCVEGLEPDPCKAAGYGDDYVCRDGLCQEIQCATDLDCFILEEKYYLCDDGFCLPCTAHGIDQLIHTARYQGQELAECPEGHICCPEDHVCDGGECFQGNCCAGPGCLPEEAIACDEEDCIEGTHQCSCGGPDKDEECFKQYHLDDCLKAFDDLPINEQLDSFCDEGTCLPLEELIESYQDALVVESGNYCLLQDGYYTGTKKPKFRCFEDGDPWSHPDLAEDDVSDDCLICWPLTPPGSKTQPSPKPGYCYIDDPDDDPDNGEAESRCYSASSASEPTPDDVRFNECKTCRPFDPIEPVTEGEMTPRDTILRWQPPEDESTDPGQLGQRAVCLDPYYFGTWDNPIPDGRWVGDQGTDDDKEVGQYVKADYPYSGGTSGRCWQTRCRGMAWQPWLPVGMASAGGVYKDIPDIFEGGQLAYFVGSFGGGFGGGLPHLSNPSGNPGCSCCQDPDPYDLETCANKCPFGQECDGCRCVCVDDGQCPSAKPICFDGICVKECTPGTDPAIPTGCPDDKPLCVNGQCYECDGPEVCAEGESCEIGECQ